MNVISFMSFIVLIITIMTLVFGVVAYFLYKARERKAKTNNKTLDYKELLMEQGDEFYFFQNKNDGRFQLKTGISENEQKGEK